MTRRESEPQDPWPADYPQQQMFELFLGKLANLSAIDEDQAARFCLTPAELAALLPVDIKTDHAQHTAESLAKFLDDDGLPADLAGAIRDWKVSIELIRSRFGWLELPPAVRKRAHQRAAALLEQAVEQGLLVPRGERWELTPQGVIAARQAMG